MIVVVVFAEMDVVAIASDHSNSFQLLKIDRLSVRITQYGI